MRGRRMGRAGLACALGLALAALAGGCGHDHHRAAEEDTRELGRSNVQVWSQTCGRCHNIKPKSSYTEEQWGVTVSHMRLRTYMTGPEKRAVLRVLAPSKVERR